MVRRISSGFGVGRMRPNLALLTALSALVTQSCGLVSSDHDDAGGSGSQLAGSAGQSGSGGSGNGGSSSGGGGSGGTSVIIIGDPEIGGRAPHVDCADDSLFEDQIVESAQIGSQRVFYSWTTSEQVAELRAGGELFSRSERPGMGRGLLFTELAAYAEPGMYDPEKLADLLGRELFAKARFAWTNPWATLLGFPGESYGDQLLRIELKPEAWIATFDNTGLRVYDTDNHLLAWETVMASPERIGAIYYASTASDRGCGSGTFVQGSVAFREFALGNLQMVEKWSLATPEITERLERDIAELKAFEAELECIVVDQADWHHEVSCLWAGDREERRPKLLANYDNALCLPSELYWPSAENVAALIAALEMTLPSGEPLEVTVGD